MTWFKKNWWVVVGLVAATAIVALTVVGILSHVEPGLMKVCWRPSGVAVYDRCPPDAEEDLLWPNGTPIDIVIHAHSGSPEDLAQAHTVVQSAVSLWNGQLGFEVFRITDEGPTEATLIWGVPSEGANQEGGSVSHHRQPDGSMTAEVAIVHVATARLSYLVVVHELGHLIGLAHDDFPSSPMYPLTRDDSEDERLGFTRVTDYDRQVLRGAYGQ